MDSLESFREAWKNGPCRCGNRKLQSACGCGTCQNCGGRCSCYEYQLDLGSENIKLANTFTLEDIRKFCLQYDKRFGMYPESDYEGRSLYTFIDSKLGTKTYDNISDYKCEAWEKEMENVGS